MGLVQHDTSADYAIASGGASLIDASRHYVSQQISQEDLDNHFSLYTEGTGGRYVISEYPSSGSCIQPAIEPRNGLATAIEEIGETFNLSKKALAEVCNVQSRKTLYNWIDGTAIPRKSSAKRIFDLLSISRSWRNAGLPSESYMLNSPVESNGATILDLLSKENLDAELILFYASRLQLTGTEAELLSDPFLQ